MPELFLLCEYATVSGGEQSMLATLDGVCAAGFSLAALAPPAGPLAEALQARGIEVIGFPVAGWHAQRDEGRGLRPAPGFPRPALRLGTCHPAQQRRREELARLLRRRRPDLLHANSLSMGRLSGPVAVEIGVPSLAHLRDIINLSRQAVADLNCHRRLLAVSQATRDAHVAAGLQSEKVHVLYNGVDLDRFRPRTSSGYLHRQLGLSPQAQLVGTIGQIGLRKGQDVLAQAAALLADKLPDLHYLVVGERFSAKAESRRFEAALHAAGGGVLAGRFHFLGYRDDVDRLLGELTLLVHPARQEPLGRVLLEAAAAGVAVIATDVGGTAEIFPPGSHSARLIPSADAAALAAAIMELVRDQPLRCRLAAAARRRAEEAFDVRTAAANLVAQYQTVL
jgi:glycosyltransferase involved in cell wall biosynthesis